MRLNQINEWTNHKMRLWWFRNGNLSPRWKLTIVAFRVRYPDMTLLTFWTCSKSLAYSINLPKSITKANPTIDNSSLKWGKLTLMGHNINKTIWTNPLLVSQSNSSSLLFYSDPSLCHISRVWLELKTAPFRKKLPLWTNQVAKSISVPN